LKSESETEKSSHGSRWRWLKSRPDLETVLTAASRKFTATPAKLDAGKVVGYLE